VSNNNHSQMWATFTDYDDNHSPYDGRALRVRVSGTPKPFTKHSERFCDDLIGRPQIA
jgi:hypothetical protein